MPSCLHVPKPSRVERQFQEFIRRLEARAAPEGAAALGRPGDQRLEAGVAVVLPQGLKESGADSSPPLRRRDVEVRHVADRGAPAVRVRHPLDRAEEDVAADLTSGLRDPRRPAVATEPVVRPLLCLFQWPGRCRWSPPLVVLVLEGPAQSGQSRRVGGPGRAHGHVGGHSGRRFRSRRGERDRAVVRRQAAPLAQDAERHRRWQVPVDVVGGVGPGFPGEAEG